MWVVPYWHDKRMHNFNTELLWMCLQTNPSPLATHVLFVVNSSNLHLNASLNQTQKNVASFRFDFGEQCKLLKNILKFKYGLQKIFDRQWMWVCELLLFFDCGLSEHLIHWKRNIFAKVIIFLKQCKILCPNHLFMKVVSEHFAREVTFVKHKSSFEMTTRKINK